jgi:hypothetical protein
MEAMFGVYNVWLADFELNQMRLLLKFLTTSIELFRQKFEEIPLPTEEDAEKNNEISRTFEEMADQISSLEGDFPIRLYSSFIIIWYSFLEDTISRLCHDTNFDHKDIPNKRGTPQLGLWDGLKFLESNNKFNISSANRKELALINQIRNQITHERGSFYFSIEKEDGKDSIPIKQGENIYQAYMEKQMYAYLKKYDLLHFYGTFFIFPKLEYCEHLIDFGSHFLDEIFHELGML